jgi:3D (Asp-Asp-Asp) domain-containing protein
MKYGYFLSITNSFITGFIVLLFSLNIISKMQQELYDLKLKNSNLLLKIDQFKTEQTKLEFSVIGTMYSPTRDQCDRTPTITADGTHINPKKASQYRFVALSRDLLARWGGPFNYGDYVAVKGTKDGKYDGIWQVRDTMSSRWTKRVDFLVTKGTAPFKYTGIKLIKMLG